MKLFFAFMVLAFLAGLIGRPVRSEGLLRVCLAAVCLALVAGYYVFHKL